MKPLRIHYLQHVPFEGLGYIQSWINENKHPLTSTKFYENEALPNLSSLDWLIIMGGPMGVYDDDNYPWLKTEKEFIREAIESGKTLIGICLGAQLIAATLGVNVYPNTEKEIGWFPVTKTTHGKRCPLLNNAPDNQTVFHWHGDTFDIPPNAIHLFKSEACMNQSFLYKEKVLALQFHMEITPNSLNAIVNACKDELIPGRYIQSEQQILKNKNIELNNQMIAKLLDKLV